MKIYRDEQVEAAILQKMRDKMDDPTRGIDGEWHASDLYSCFRQKVKEKVDGAPFHNRGTIVRFMFGFAVEDWVFDGDEKKRETHLGVLFTVDGRASTGAVLEMKTTAMYMPKFDDAALRGQEHWIERTKGYCATRDENKAHVIVFFIYQRDYLAFTIEFTDSELAEAKAAIPRLRDTLDRGKARYIKSKVLPGVETRSHEWECGYCEYRILLGCDADAKAIGMKMPPLTKEKKKKAAKPAKGKKK